MSFTTGALLYREMLTVARLFAEMDDWEAVRERVIEDNLLQMRTLNTSKRVYREVASRLRRLSTAERRLLLEGTRPEKNYLLWLAVCKRYRFIHDFAVEVLREKYLRLELDLAYDEYDIFFYDKAEWHPEVEGVAESTRKKQRQFIFKMLREAELLSDNGRIIPALLTPRLVETIADDDAAHLAVFPVSELELQGWLS
jgi:hypothetical protein